MPVNNLLQLKLRKTKNYANFGKGDTIYYASCYALTRKGMEHIIKNQEAVLRDGDNYTYANPGAKHKDDITRAISMPRLCYQRFYDTCLTYARDHKDSARGRYLATWLEPDLYGAPTDEPIPPERLKNDKEIKTEGCGEEKNIIILSMSCDKPLYVKEEKAIRDSWAKDIIEGKYKNIIFSILGMGLVVGISLLNTKSGLVDVGNITHLTIPLAIYIFLTGAIAITAMVLPGISGSTLLLIFGLYMPIMTAIKKVLSFNFNYALPLLIFLAGILVGIVTFVRLIKKALVKYRSQTIYTIIGMMLGSLYAIIQGPTTLKVPQPAMTFQTFSVLWFIIGAVIIFLLQLFKKVMEK